MTYQQFIQDIINQRGQHSEEITKNYYEKHHILPKCKNGSDDINNIIWLTPQEHYKAHMLLALENPTDISLVTAWNAMSGWKKEIRQITITADEYAVKRELLSINMSQRQQGSNNSFYGKHHTKDTRKLISSKGKGVKRSEEFKRNCSQRQQGTNNSFYGKHHTEDILKKISEASKTKWQDEAYKEKQHKIRTELHLKWWNNGINEVKSDVQPYGYIEGRLPKHTHWFTNGEDEIKSTVCPDGWWSGRSNKSKDKISNTKKQNT